MPRVKMIPSEWGILATDQSLTDVEIEIKIREILDQMTVDEKISQMSGDFPLFPTMLEMFFIYNKSPYPAGENFRLQIPGIRFSDGPRGIVVNNSTCFPVSIARGATWDPALEERIGDAMGIEARSEGINLVAAVCINLLRHPSWGRAQETFGEDPFHVGEMGAALVRGLQRHVMACIKHFACNNSENNRHKVNVQISERTLREIYLPHFKRCIDEGAACVMGAYNKVNNEYCCQNKHLLSDILKNEWGFPGFTISDFTFGIRDSQKAVAAGMDIEMPTGRYYGKRLKRLITDGKVSINTVDDSVTRILRQKIRFAGIGDASQYKPEAIASKSHQSLAREAAVKSIVLLKNEPPADQLWFPDHTPSFANLFSMQPKNPPPPTQRRNSGKRIDREILPELSEPLLPINLNKIHRLIVIGKLASQENLGDHGSSWVRPPQVVTPLEGIRKLAQDRCEIIYDDTQNPSRMLAKVREADSAIIFAGYTYKDEGENLPGRGGDRKSLELSQIDAMIILSTLAANPRTVVVLIGGGPILMDKWIDYAPAVLMAWYPGMQGGNALADILFGLANPSGKLPCVFPHSTDQLPAFNNKAKTVDYDYYHGYRLIDKLDDDPLFHFGHGLSYTTYSYDNLVVEKEAVSGGDTITSQISITNTGKRIGEEVVQLYIGYPGKINRPVKELKGFQRIRLDPGETKIVTFDIKVHQLSYFNEATSSWEIEPGEHMIWIGGSSSDTDLIRCSIWINK